MAANSFPLPLAFLFYPEISTRMFSLTLLQAQGAAGGLGGVMQFLPLVGILVVFYFFMIRPQQQRTKKEQAFREALKKGDKVRTIGGIHGTIDSVQETTMVVRVDDNLKMTFDKSAVIPVA